MTTKVCIDADCAQPGQPQPIEAFGWRNMAENKRRNRCRPCQNRYIRASRSGLLAQKQVVEQPLEGPPAPAEPQLSWNLTLASQVLRQHPMGAGL